MGTTATTMFPGLTLSAAFGVAANAVPTALQWIDVTSDLRSGAIERGRKRETEVFQAGVMRLVMNNRSRQWDPEYSSGAHFGNIVPMLQFRLVARYNSINYTIFQGYAESFGQEYPGYDADSVCEIVVVDGFSVLSNTKLPDSVWDIVTLENVTANAGSFWYPLGEKYGQIMGDRGPNNYHGSYGAQIVSNQPGIVPYAGTGQALLFDGIDDVGLSPTGIFPAVPYTVGFWVKIPDDWPVSTWPVALAYDDTTATSSAKSIVFYFDSNGRLVVYNNEMGPVWTLNPRYSDNPLTAGGIYHIVFAYGSGGNPNLYINGVLQTLTGSGFSSISLFITLNRLMIGGEAASSWTSFRGVLDEVVVIGGFLTSTEVLEWYESGSAPWAGTAPGTLFTSGQRFTKILDAVAWPTSLRDLDTGSSNLGPATLTGTAHAYLQLVETTEQGRYHMTADGNVRFVGRENLLSEAIYTTSQATFGDGGGSELPYHGISVEPSNVQQIWNDATSSRQGGIDQQVTDTTSAGQYGTRSAPSLSGLLMGTDHEAYDLAYNVVQRYKDPGYRVTELIIEPQRSPAALFPKVLGYELGTKLTTVRRPRRLGSAITKDVHIEGIRHEFDAVRRWTTTWSTGSVDPNEDLWAIVDSATQGIVDTNLVSY